MKNRGRMTSVVLVSLVGLALPVAAAQAAQAELVEVRIGHRPSVPCDRLVLEARGRIKDVTTEREGETLTVNSTLSAGDYDYGWVNDAFDDETWLFTSLELALGADGRGEVVVGLDRAVASYDVVVLKGSYEGESQYSRLVIDVCEQGTVAP